MNLSSMDFEDIEKRVQDIVEKLSKFKGDSQGYSSFVRNLYDIVRRIDYEEKNNASIIKAKILLLYHISRKMDKKKEEEKKTLEELRKVLIGACDEMIEAKDKKKEVVDKLKIFLQALIAGMKYREVMNSVSRGR